LLQTWEGGVKGTAFVWSPLLENTPRVSKQMMHIQDWIPTLLGAFGKKPTGNKYELDGVNVWNALNNPDVEGRSEVLHMIDPIGKYAALRVGNWKLTVGEFTVYFKITVMKK
jgi:arylsulfatase B